MKEGQGGQARSPSRMCRGLFARATTPPQPALASARALVHAALPMDGKPNIVLLGFMGTGKTSVGRALAQRLRMTFADMDALIEEREGKSISRIFAEDGEPHFRALERALVSELAAGTGRVIGAGGGVVLNPDNVRDFERTGLAVCLSATPEEILRRVRDDAARPLLAGGDKLASIVRILEQRRQHYAAIRRRIDTTGLTVPQVVERILAMYGAYRDATAA